MEVTNIKDVNAHVFLHDEVNILKEQIANIESRLAKIENTSFPQQEDIVSIVVFSGSLDKLLAAFIIATGAAMMGMKVEMFFTFWATSALKKAQRQMQGKTMLEKMFCWMLPRGPKQVKLSQMNMGGIGTFMIKWLMKKKNIASLDELIEMAAELDIKLNICEMSMDLMGIKSEELLDNLNFQYCGVATFLETALKGKITLFV